MTVSLPYDELDFFNNEEMHQFVQESTLGNHSALILSTVVYEYLTGTERSRSLIATKRRLYLLQNESNTKMHLATLHAIEIAWVESIVLSDGHPQLVIKTIAEQDDLRLATTSDERYPSYSLLVRCEAIVLALTYLFTMFLKRPLICYKVKKATLEDYEQRKDNKSKGGRNEPMALLRDVDPKYLMYQQSGVIQPQSEHTVFKHDDKNILLSKIYFKEKLSEAEYVKSYICKIELEPGICFVYEKDFVDLKAVQKHSNIHGIVRLLYAIESQHKMFLVYEYIRHQHHIDEEYLGMVALRLLDSTDKFRKAGIRYPLLCKSNLLFGNEVVVWKEFRYGCHPDPIHALVCTAPEVLLEHFLNDVYSLGVLLFELVFSIAPFMHKDPQVIVSLKMESKVGFPRYMRKVMSDSLKSFVLKVATYQTQCLTPKPFERFQTIEQLREHPWMKAI